MLSSLYNFLFGKLIGKRVKESYKTYLYFRFYSLVTAMYWIESALDMTDDNRFCIKLTYTDTKAGLVQAKLFTRYWYQLQDNIYIDITMNQKDRAILIYSNSAVENTYNIGKLICIEDALIKFMNNEQIFVSHGFLHFNSLITEDVEVPTVISILENAMQIYFDCVFVPFTRQFEQTANCTFTNLSSNDKFIVVIDFGECDRGEEYVVQIVNALNKRFEYFNKLELSISEDIFKGSILIHETKERYRIKQTLFHNIGDVVKGPYINDVVDYSGFNVSLLKDIELEMTAVLTPIED